MAAAGDVVIKLAADVADLKTGLADATAKLDEFGKTAQQISENMTTAATKGATFGNLIADGIKFAIQQIKQLATESERSSLEIAKQATALKLSAEQFQAYKLAAAQAGVSVEEATKQLRGNQDATDRLIRYYRDLGQVIDNEAVAKFARMNTAAEESERRINAIIAPLYASAKATVLDAVADSLERIKQVIATFDISKAETIMKLVLLSINPAAGLMAFGVLPGVGPTPITTELEKLDTQITETVNRLSQLRSGAAAAMPMIGRDNEIAMLDKKLEQLQQERAKLTSPVATFPPLVVKPGDETKPTAGGGRTDAENMDAQIARYRALGAAATKAYEDIQGRHFTLVEDIQRELRVQQQVEQVAARLGAKYKDASEPQKQLLHDAIDGWERAKEASAEYVRQVQAAEDINARFGGGTAARDRAQRELDRARRGGADPAALSRAAKQQEEQITSAERAARRYDDSIENLGDGFLDAADKFARSNDLFTQGGAMFTGLANTIGEAFEIMANRSSKSFQQLAADFATMLAKIALQMAISQAFKYLVGLVGSAAGSVTAVPGPAGGYAATLDPNTGMTTLTPRAGGGGVYPGNAYRVGEYGPETFVPAAAGRIEPYSSSNGGGSVTVNVDMKKAEGARDPASALEFGRRVKVAVMGVIEDEKRPGGSLYRGAAA